MDPSNSSTPPLHPVMGAPVTYPPAAYPPGAPAYDPQFYAPPPAPQAVAAQQKLQAFWEEQEREIKATTDFKNLNLPLARIKKIMRADEDVRMIAVEALFVFARACELFILELTHRSWAHAQENQRRTLQKSDIAAAIARTEVFDFLVDIVPRDDAKDAEAAAAAAAAAIPYPVAAVPSGQLVSLATDPLAYYYFPRQ